MEGERGEKIIFYLYDLNKPPECYEKNTQGTIPSYSVDKKQNKTKLENLESLGRSTRMTE